MSPKSDNQDPNSKLDVTVNIPHEQKQTHPAPTTAPPLPQLEPLPIRPIKITDNIPPPPPTVPVVPPVSPYEFHEHEGRRWPVILVYVLMAFLVALLVVFAGRWIYRKTTHHAAKVNKPTGAQQGNVPASPPTSSSQSSGQGSSSPSSTTPTNPSSSQNPAAGSTQLPNNGPGDVVAIFVGTALAAGGLHYIDTLRRSH